MSINEDPTNPFWGQPKSPGFGTGSGADVNRLHDYDDVDNSLLSHHHTLGSLPGQASPGDHIHDGRTSKILPAQFLGELDTSIGFSHTSGAATVIHALTVKIPLLSKDFWVELIGTVGLLVTPAGVGATLAITNAAIGRDYVSGGSSNFPPPTVIKWDKNPTAGNKTYNFTLQTTVSGNTVNISRMAQLAARILY